MEGALRQARDVGFLGPGPVERHLRHALGFAMVLESSGGVGREPSIDLGSGGGVPGLVLACIWPDVPWTLLDSMDRRTAFLQTAVSELGLDHAVSVWRIRAEDAGRSTRRGTFAIVTARGFAGPAVTAECAAPLLSVSGRLVVSEPPEGIGPARWSLPALARLGLTLEKSERVTVGLGIIDGSAGDQGVRSSDASGEFGYQVLRQVTPCPEGYPRRSGQLLKRPIW